MAGMTGIGGVFFRARDPQARPDGSAAHPGLTPGPGGLPWQEQSGLTLLAHDTSHLPADRAVMPDAPVDAPQAHIHDPEGTPVDLRQPPR